MQREQSQRKRSSYKCDGRRVLCERRPRRDGRGLGPAPTGAMVAEFCASGAHAAMVAGWGPLLQARTVAAQAQLLQALLQDFATAVPASRKLTLVNFTAFFATPAFRRALVKR